MTTNDCWDCFDKWCRKTDPDGERDIFDLIKEYCKPKQEK